MADASDSTSSERRTIKRQAPNDTAEQPDETRRKRSRQADPQQPSNPSFLFSPSTLPENTIDVTSSDDEDHDVFMDWAHEESPMRDSNEVTASASSGPFDACFGLLEIPATIDASSVDASHFPVNAETSGKALKILDVESGAQIGSASLPMSTVLFHLQERAKVSFTATITEPETRRQSRYVRATLRLVVFGYMSEKQTVAKTLYDGDLYLQHPSLSECGSQVPYFNPQYLVRPGGSMPKLKDLAITSRSGPGGRARDALTEVEKYRMLQIFESAQDPDAAFGVRPSSRLQTVLKDHQISALAMMIEKECGNFDDAKFPSLWEPTENPPGVKYYRHIVTNQRRERHPSLVRGGVLADEMGLGKSLSAIALILWHIDVLESSNPGTSSTRPTLIVGPKSTIPEWKQQFQRHVKPGRIHIQIHHGPNRQVFPDKWHNEDVVITTYDTLRSESHASGPLFQMDWARVILDEAHNIRNPESRVFAAAQAVRAPCRWCLTGTPIQNRLEDLAALLSFIRVPSLELVNQFNDWISKPILKKKKYAFGRLRSLVKATCLRRTKRSTGSALNLPKKEETTLVLDLEQHDRELYNFFKYQAATAVQKIRQGKPFGGSTKGTSAMMILPLINNLRRICDHGSDLLSSEALQAWRNRNVDLIDWQLIAAGLKRCDGCGGELEDSDEATVSVELACGHLHCTNCYTTTREDSKQSREACARCSKASPLPTGSSDGHGLAAEGEYIPGVKVDALLQTLSRERSAGMDQDGSGTKSVVFSCWTKMLDLIQKALQRENIGFRRIDGQTTLKGREDALEDFRTDANCQVMLASIGSVGEGVNLTVASSVHIMEPHWNPMVEAQAVDRVHRIGQQKDVFITRYLIKDSIEFYVRGVQQDKIRLIQQSLSSTEVSQKDVDRNRFQKLVECLS